jgi:hypothetical protein
MMEVKAQISATCQHGDVNMKYQIAPLFCRPWTLLGITPRLIESHYENNSKHSIPPRRRRMSSAA